MNVSAFAFALIINPQKRQRVAPAASFPSDLLLSHITDVVGKYGFADAELMR